MNTEMDKLPPALLEACKNGLPEINDAAAKSSAPGVLIFAKETKIGLRWVNKLSSLGFRAFLLTRKAPFSIEASLETETVAKMVMGFIDLDMPEALSFIQTIRSNGKRDILLIGATRVKGKRCKEAALLIGLDTVVQKPVQKAKITQAIWSVIRRGMQKKRYEELLRHLSIR